MFPFILLRLSHHSGIIFLCLSFILLPHIYIFAQQDKTHITPMSDIDWEIFGPTRIEGMVGNGAISVGISKWGEITVLRYPSPSFWDQLDFRAKEGEMSRNLTYFGARENQGAYPLLIVETDRKMLISLRDLENISQRYKSDNSAILLTEYKVEGVGKVKMSDFVHPQKDIMVRKFEFEFEQEFESQQKSAYLIHYQNFAPTTIKIPKTPIEDWVDDTRNDFGAYTSNGFAFHFTPYGENRDELKNEYENVRNSNINHTNIVRYAEGITGIFIAVFALSDGGNVGNAYVGFDERCGGSRRPPPQEIRIESAFSKMKNVDIERGISPYQESFSICSADSFVMVKICDAGRCKKVAYIVVVAGRNQKEVGESVNFAISNIKRLEEDTENHWIEIVRKLEAQSWFPKLQEGEQKLCKRALISIIEGTDRGTKATVASISTQPPYAEDWPRDGAFFNIFLNLAGFTELAADRNVFYEKVQSKEREGDIPAGTWRMNFYADGMIGGPWDFEIDQVGFVLWSWATHTLFDRKFVEKVYSAAKLSADEVLIKCKDEKTGLQCLAHEDDNTAKTITMIGSGTVYTGLKSMLHMAILMRDKEFIRKIEDRIREMESAIRNAYASEEGFVFRATDPIPGIQYLLFPAGFPLTPEEVRKYGENIIDVLKYNFSPERGYLLYEGKWIISLIVAAKLINDKFPETSSRFYNEAEKFLRVLVEDVPTTTYHMGEVARYVDGRYENRVAIPHIWQATLTCLTAIALREPDILYRMGVFFETRFEEKTDPGGCGGGGDLVGCSLASGTQMYTIFLFVIIYRVLISIAKKGKVRGSETKEN